VDVHNLPHVNALLNAIAGVMLVIGVRLVRQGKEEAHKRVMLGSFLVSVIFLACYLVYHYHAGSVKFPSYPPAWIRYLYLSILLTHIVLAALVPFLALITIYLGLKDRRDSHRRWARWTFPIWLYVSVTGVIVYLMLYQIFPPQKTDDTIERAGQGHPQVDVRLTWAVLPITNCQAAPPTQHPFDSNTKGTTPCPQLDRNNADPQC